MRNRIEATDLVPTLERVLCCPKCGAAFRRSEVVVECQRCSFACSVLNGAYDLRIADRSVSRLPDDVVERMVLDAQQSDWRTALHDSLRLIDPARYRAMTDDFRSAWRLLAPIEPGQRVLVLEAGPSNLLPQLAAAGMEVIGLLGSLQSARFTSLRLRQSGSHTALVGAALDQPNLPIQANTVDAVLVDNIAGWGIGVESGQRALGRLIGECRRVLRPGGSLTLMFDNAFGLDRLTRPLIGRTRAPVYERAAFGAREQLRWSRGFRLGAARQYLSEAGFEAAQTFAILPFAETPLYLVPVDDLQLFARTVRRLAHAYDWSLHARHRQLGPVAELIGMAAHVLQSVPGATILRLTVPSICVVARVGTG